MKFQAETVLQVVLGRDRMIQSAIALPSEGSMTAPRLGHVLTGLSFGVMASTGVLALPVVGSHPAMAQNPGPAALTGTVSSREEGKMEGVVVNAKRPGSTTMVSVRSIRSVYVAYA